MVTQFLHKVTVVLFGLTFCAATQKKCMCTSTIATACFSDWQQSPTFLTDPERIGERFPRPLLCSWSFEE